MAQKDGNKLTDNVGHSYFIKRVALSLTTWRCTSHACRCFVKQYHETNVFTVHGQHNCRCDPSTADMHQLCTDLKLRACEPFIASSAIVAEAVNANIRHNVPVPSMPKMESLVRHVNRLRQKTRPPNPTDLAFELNARFIPQGFHH